MRQFIFLTLLTALLPLTASAERLIIVDPQGLTRFSTEQTEEETIELIFSAAVGDGEVYLAPDGGLGGSVPCSKVKPTQFECKSVLGGRWVLQIPEGSLLAKITSR